jgi:hypothetical protein
MSDTVSAAIRLVNELVEAADVAKNAGLRLLFADLKDELARISREVRNLTEERNTLRNQLQVLTSTSSSIRLRGDLYFTETGNGPYCTSCFDARNELNQVVPISRYLDVIGKFNCGVCGSYYKGES